MRTEQFIPSTGNLSLAWAQAFLKVMERGVGELSPLVVTVSDITSGNAVEDSSIRRALDQHLNRLGRANCHTVANTIFPQSLWNPSIDNDAEALFSRFERAWPRIQRCRANNRGSYFHRLMAYQPVGVETPVNQLKHIIETYNGGNHRRSALQASVFDPTRDHNDCRQLGFPCLHQVAVAPVGDSGLAITGFYATQFLFDRAYGNYLGLCRLGHFMAKHLGLTFERMVCVASVAQRGTPNKSELAVLAKEVSDVVADSARDGDER